MKYIPSIAFEEMSGSAKGVFKRLTTMWRGLTNDQILAWNKLALSQEARSVLGTKGKISGASRAHSKAAAIKMVEEPTAAAIDIRADYVAKNGAPSAAAPKIFFRYYYVNSSTGEKSGVMLADVTWTAGE